MISFIKRIGNLQKIALFTTLCIPVVIAVTTLTPGAGKLAPQGADKLLHTADFALLVMPMLMVRLKTGLVIAPLALLALLFGAAIELIQPYVNRFGDFSDFWADFVGVLIGVNLAILLNPFIKQYAARNKSAPESKK
ncbi:VanZ family protein [Paracoccaceae bacterium]|nr:VanZ family protein [Paracoccaceae bacterium]